MRRLVQLIGEAYLLGSAALAFLLMALSVAGIRWSRTAVIVAAITVIVAAILVIRRHGSFDWPRPVVCLDTTPGVSAIERASKRPYVPKAMPTSAAGRAGLGWPNLIDVLTFALIAGYVRLTTLAPPAEADFYAMWGAKAKQFFMTGGIDWRFLQDPLNLPSHVDYPILLPLLYDVQALMAGGWPDERWFALIHIAAGTAALLVIRSLLADEMPKLARAVATLILMPLVFSPYFGLPEGLLVAYGTLALLILRRAIRDEDRAAALRGALYLGLAASCKNEGAALVAAVAIALILTRPRWIVRLWPAVMVALPWLLLRWHYGLESDLAQTGAFARLMERLAHPGPLFEALRAVPHGGALFWAGVALALAIGLRRILEEERFLAIAIVMQILFFIGAYLVTPYDLAWHVRTSWERVVRQLLPAVALLALLVTVIRFRAENTNAIDP